MKKGYVYLYEGNNPIGKVEVDENTTKESLYDVLKRNDLVSLEKDSNWFENLTSGIILLSSETSQFKVTMKYEETSEKPEENSVGSLSYKVFRDDREVAIKEIKEVDGVIHIIT